LYISTRLSHTYILTNILAHTPSLSYLCHGSLSLVIQAVGESGEKPLEYYDNNVGGTIQLIKLMRQYHCYSIVFSSSACVYGTPTKSPITEQEPCKPENTYGRTKYMIEQILMDLGIISLECPRVCVFVLSVFRILRFLAVVFMYVRNVCVSVCVNECICL